MQFFHWSKSVCSTIHTMLYESLFLEIGKSKSIKDRHFQVGTLIPKCKVSKIQSLSKVFSSKLPLDWGRRAGLWHHRLRVNRKKAQLPLKEFFIESLLMITRQQKIVCNVTSNERYKDVKIFQRKMWSLLHQILF